MQIGFLSPPFLTAWDPHFIRRPTSSLEALPIHFNMSRLLDIVHMWVRGPTYRGSALKSPPYALLSCLLSYTPGEGVLLDGCMAV
jgi:hypothetical protein